MELVFLRGEGDLGIRRVDFVTRLVRLQVIGERLGLCSLIVGWWG